MVGYEFNKKIAKIRHTETNYDALDVFYHIDCWTGKLRRKLNWLCVQLANQEIELIEFENLTSQINADINLNRKSNQKKFIEAKMQELALIYPNASKSFVKAIARQALKNIQYEQQRRNIKRTKYSKLYFIED